MGFDYNHNTVHKLTASKNKSQTTIKKIVFRFVFLLPFWIAFIVISLHYDVLLIALTISVIFFIITLSWLLLNFY